MKTQSITYYCDICGIKIEKDQQYKSTLIEKGLLGLSKYQIYAYDNQHFCKQCVDLFVLWVKSRKVTR